MELSKQLDVFDPNTLPTNDNVNPYAFSISLDKNWFLAKGAMIAYYGDARFEAVTRFASRAAWAAASFSSPLYQQDWVVAEGRGKVVVADRGYDVNSFDLEDGNLTIRSSNLLGFESDLQLKQSIVPGFLTLLGTGKFISSSNGPVMFVEPPFRADPEALLGWADCPSPSQHYDTNWMQGSLAGMIQGALGRQSGEERQYDFTGAGTVLLQSSESMLSDRMLYRNVESQTALLSDVDAVRLGRQLMARAQQ